MKSVITTERIPIKMWIDEENVEASALAQARNTANLPFAFHHVALMPDVHTGYGMPIGNVVATQNVISPNMVGVDIGCGMCVAQTMLTDIDTDTLKKILGDIRQQVPLGFNRHKVCDEAGMNELELNINVKDMLHGYPIVSREWQKVGYQLGTLGGGNHFIEIQKGDDGYIWIMVHSGSRNLGKQVADHYHKVAEELNEKYFSSVPKKWQLAFLPLDSEEGKQYKLEMDFCLAFAQANRDKMMRIIKDIFAVHVSDVDFGMHVNIHHNYAAMENHFNRNVMIHRKGATLARKGQKGIIPGSQGTSSYIVEGLGNPDSFHSCSHGAGRVMSRRQAKRELDLKAEQKRLDDQGILHAIRHKDDLDEASGAYKDIDKVMENQADLVDVLVELSPLAVVKG